MCIKRFFLTTIFAVFLGVSASAEVLDTGQIDLVIEKAAGIGVLDEDDFTVIDDFINSAVEQMLLSEDALESVEARTQISTRKGPEKRSQYTVAFKSSAAEHLSKAFEELQQWDQGSRKVQAQRNIIILAAQMRDLEFVQLALGAIDNQDLTARYWAVMAITNDAITNQLNSEAEDNADMTGEIVAKLESVIQTEKHSEILSLAVRFADRLEGDDGQRLLLSIAELRQKAYENWTVEYELMDAKLLKSLSRVILRTDDTESRADLNRSFAQLYSYIIQRYLSGADVLTDSARAQMASVIVDVEQNVIGTLLGVRQSGIQSAVEKNKSAVLQREHDFLLGSATRAGSLPEKLKFTYGTDAEGNTTSIPKQLPAPPEPPEEMAENTEAK